MQELSTSDLRRAIDCLHALLSVGDLEQFTDMLARVMPPLVDAEVSAYNELDPSRGRFTLKMNPADAADPSSITTFLHHAHENPLLRHIREKPADLGVYRITDLTPQSEFRKTTLCNEVYRGFGAEYQMSMPLVQSPTTTVAMAFNRSSDFTDRDRSLLSLIQPLLILAYRNASAMHDLKLANRDLLKSIDSMQQGIVLVSCDGRVLARSALAAELLDQLNSASRGGLDRLPDAIVRWLGETRQAIESLQPVPDPLPLETAGRRICVSLIGTGASCPDTGASLLMLSELASSQTPALCSLGLTRRQADVLWSLAQGLSNKEIAAAQNTSVRTIEKHVENIFKKLNVTSRTGACAAALRAAAQFQS